ncbi:hypothetical protein AC249_AIPGENE22863 [Exaiptasia diaphana]|nr:hypothetical protein AC249_AIPGENE22863 [Exaiptasia diaphana]
MEDKCQTRYGNLNKRREIRDVKAVEIHLLAERENSRDIRYMVQPFSDMFLSQIALFHYDVTVCLHRENDAQKQRKFGPIYIVD